MRSSQSEVLAVHMLVVQSCQYIDDVPKYDSALLLNSIASFIAECERGSGQHLGATIAPTRGDGLICARELISLTRSEATVKESRHLDEFQMRPEFADYMWEYLWGARMSGVPINTFLRLQSAKERELREMGEKAFFEILDFGSNHGREFCLAVVDPELFYAICTAQRIVPVGVTSSGLHISPTTALSLMSVRVSEPRALGIAVRFFAMPHP